ncbi:MAG: endolytic transglycosylase MltG [Holosporales bacterium]|jgi:UPF0755 protein
MRRVTALFLGCLTACLGVAVLGVGWLWYTAPINNSSTAISTVVIKPGNTHRIIAKALEDSIGISARIWLVLLEGERRLYGGTAKAGEYALAERSSPREIIKLLLGGASVQHRITLIDGWTSQKIIGAINTSSVFEGEPLKKLKEGSILPDTYFISRGIDREVFIERLQHEHLQVISAVWRGRAADSPLQTPEEAIILASIIARESNIPEEYPVVAGVFHNRLRLGMPLQSDPTVIYAVSKGLGELPRPLSRADLRYESPYNTYVTGGLPPGPICHPPLAALRAAVHPQRTKYLYFVANGSGGHTFAETLEEHNRNVARWRALSKDSD